MKVLVRALLKWILCFAFLVRLVKRFFQFQKHYLFPKTLLQTIGKHREFGTKWVKNRTKEKRKGVGGVKMENFLAREIFQTNLLQILRQILSEFKRINSILFPFL